MINWLVWIFDLAMTMQAAKRVTIIVGLIATGIGENEIPTPIIARSTNRFHKRINSTVKTKGVGCAPNLYPKYNHK